MRSRITWQDKRLMNRSKPTPTRMIEDIKEHLNCAKTLVIAPFMREKDCGMAFKVYVDGYCGDYAIEVRYNGPHRIKFYQYVSGFQYDVLELEIEWNELLSIVSDKYNKQRLNAEFVKYYKYIKDVIASIVFDCPELLLHLGSEVDIWGRFSGHVSGKFGEYDIYVWRRESAIRVNHLNGVWEVICSFPVRNSFLFHLIQDNY